MGRVIIMYGRAILQTYVPETTVLESTHAYTLLWIVTTIIYVLSTDVIPPQDAIMYQCAILRHILVS